MIIRDSVDTDSTSIQTIYAAEVLSGTASFEFQAPDVDEIRERRKSLVAAGYPHIVGEIHGSIAGYAYAGPYRSRPGYRYTVENSVYVAAWARGQGVGRRLLGCLIERCEGAGFRQMVAVIGDSAHSASIRLHSQAGFRRVGTLENVGFKFERWLDSVLMQRRLGPSAQAPPDTNGLCWG